VSNPVSAIGFDGPRSAWRPKVETRREETPKIQLAKGWCGLGWVQSLSNFNGLDTPKSRFLNQKLVSQITNTLTNKKKTINNIVKQMTIQKTPIKFYQIPSKFFS
jgi:hypothetical protein